VKSHASVASPVFRPCVWAAGCGDEGEAASANFMNIILDSTAIRHDYFLSSPDARLLELYVGRTHSSLVVPHVVIDEAVNLYREDLLELRGKFVSKYRQLLTMRSREVPDVDPDEECKAYKKQLLSDIQGKFRGVLLPYPDISHEQLVRRDLDRRKPFGSTGKGYRDALIWISIMTYLSTKSDTACLISNNTKDFWNSEGNALHGDLAEELLAAKSKQALRIFKDVAEFNRAVVSPSLKKLESIVDDLRKGTFNGLDTKELMLECRSDVKRWLKQDATLSRLIRSQIGRVDFEDLSQGDVGKPYDIEVQPIPQHTLQCLV
jgi:hypothetical protein